jgi:hypothetical protein
MQWQSTIADDGLVSSRSAYGVVSIWLYYAACFPFIVTLSTVSQGNKVLIGIIVSRYYFLLQSDVVTVYCR